MYVFALFGKPTEEEYRLLSPVFQKNLGRFKLDIQKRQIIQHWKKHVLPNQTVEGRLDAISNMQPLLIRAFQADFPDDEPTYMNLRSWIKNCLISARLCKCKDFPYWMELWLWFQYWYAYNRVLEKIG